MPLGGTIFFMKKRSKGRRTSLVVAIAVVATLLLIGFGLRREMRAWYVLFTEFERLPNNEQGYSEYRHVQTGIVFVLVPGGSFSMGSPETETGREDNEGPVHKVRLSPYLISKYEVTQEQWKRIMEINPSRSIGDELPVHRIAWENCEEFCRRTGLSLPTEAQWEYACKARTTTPFAFGDTLSTKQANFASEHPVAVDSFAPNAFGLHNMHGNVLEWCQDSYDPSFYERPEASHQNPVCTEQRRGRVVRGGSIEAVYCRSAARSFGFPEYRRVDVGFRPVFQLH